MMKELQKLLEIREIAFDAVDSRISCFPHVVNLATQCILKSMTDPEQMGETEDFEEDELEGQGDVSRVDDDEEDSTNSHPKHQLHNFSVLCKI
jgi:hypothetical protein